VNPAGVVAALALVREYAADPTSESTTAAAAANQGRRRRAKEAKTIGSPRGITTSSPDVDTYSRNADPLTAWTSSPQTTSARVNGETDKTVEWIAARDLRPSQGGSGGASGQRFTVPAKAAMAQAAAYKKAHTPVVLWQLSGSEIWSYDCSGFFGSSGDFIATINGSDSDTANNQLGPP
jgi:hypothetical protein